MAQIGRVLARQGFRLLTKPQLQLARTIKPTACFISTSKKNKDAMVVEKTISKPEVEENLEAKEENWISYGYSLVDREEDEFNHHLLTFVSVTLCLVGGGYFLAYFPDLKERDWIQREAYLELARREQEGLPLIDKNLISPDKITLPDDEQLGDFEIII